MKYIPIIAEKAIQNKYFLPFRKINFMYSSEIDHLKLDVLTRF